YDFITNSVIIPAGQTSVTIPVRPHADEVVEGPETVVLTVQSAEGYTVGSQGAAVVRIDDASQPRFVPTQIQRATDGTVTLVIEVPSTGNYSLEYSNDLTTWTLLQTVPGSAQPVTVQDTSAQGQSQRFYRLR
ncbi:MAG TPA: hypothetical protein VHH73_16625, partial [Verrucomicrobiae bacterium]|nr:hypothetical protein [Verrucomicrobiae bacterium]